MSSFHFRSFPNLVLLVVDSHLQLLSSTEHTLENEFLHNLNYGLKKHVSETYLESDVSYHGCLVQSGTKGTFHTSSARFAYI